jgi:hypothetical protein
MEKMENKIRELFSDKQMETSRGEIWERARAKRENDNFVLVLRWVATLKLYTQKSLSN